MVTSFYTTKYTYGHFLCVALNITICHKKIDDIKSSIEGIKASLKDIFTDSAVVNGFNNFMERMAVALGKEAGALVSIGATMAQNLLGGLDKYLSQNSQFIKDRLITFLDIRAEIEEIVADFMVAFADVFSVFGGETGQQITANIIGIFANGLMGAFEIFMKFTRDITKALTEPFVSNKDLIKTTLEETLKPIESITGTIKDFVTNTFISINKAYDEHVKPAFENITMALTNLMTNLLNNYNTYILPVINGVASKIEELFNNYIQPNVDLMIDAIGRIIEAASRIFLEVIEPMVEDFNNLLGPAIAWIIEKISDFAIKLAEDLFTALGNVADAIADVCTWLAEHKTATEVIITLLGSFAAAIGIVKVAMNAGAIAQAAITAATTAWNVVAGIGTTVTGAFGAAIALLTSPITLVVAAIAAVIAIVVLLVRHWDEVKETAAKCWDWIVEKWTSAGEWFNTTVVEPIKQFFSGLWEGIKATASNCWNGIVSVWNAASTWFNTTIIEPIKNFFIKLWLEIQQKAEFAWTYIKGIWGAATNWFSTTIIEPIKNKFSEWSAKVKQLAVDAWNGLKNTWNSAKQWFSSTVIDPIATAFSKLWNGLKTSASNAFTEVGNSAKRGMNWVIDHINNMINKINSKLSFTLPEFFGGGKVGFNIPNVPRLARGGIVDGATFMGNYIAGEAGKEMIVPLENTSFTDKIASAMGQAVMNSMAIMLNGNSGTGNTQQNVVLEWDGVAFARTAAPYMIKEMRRLGIEI